MARLNQNVMASPRQPMLWVAVSFASGIAVAHEWWRPPVWWAVAAAVFAASAITLMRRRSRAAFLLALCGVGFAGALSYAGRSSAFANETRNRDIERFTDGREVTVVGTAVTDGVVRRSGRDVRERADLEVESITGDDGTVPVRSGLRINVYSRGEGEDGDPQRDAVSLRYGDRIRFRTRMRPPRNFGNAGAWDYRGYLAEDGILALGSVRADRIERLGAEPASRVEWWRNRLRRSVSARVHEVWSREQAALIDTMLIGENSYLERRIRTEFQRSGTYHILVVSGMNIGILAFAVFWTLRRVRGGEIAASITAVILSAGYAFLANAGAPILRAALMMVIALGARLFYRERALLNGLGIAALVLLAADPRGLFEPSFQLTFLSVLAILAIGVPLLERTSLPYRKALQFLDSQAYDVSLAPKIAQFRLDMRLLAGRVAQFTGVRPARWILSGMVLAAISVFDIVVISAIVQISLALPMAIYFHRESLLALPANIAVIPLTGVLMPSAFLAVGLSYIAPAQAGPFALVAGWALRGISSAVSVVSNLPGSDLRIASPSREVVLLGVAAFVLAAALARRRGALAASGVAAILGVAAWLVAVPPRPAVRSGVLEVTAIDVGQAESTLVVSPDGHTLLVDAAGAIGAGESEFDFGEDVISPYLWARGIVRLDAVALTHAHSDHIGGMRSVLTNFRPRELWIGPNTVTPALSQLLRQASEQGVVVRYHAAGDAFAFGAAEVRVLAPSREWAPSAWSHNDDSLVMRIGYKNSAALLTADAEKKTERFVASQQPQADLLKVAHNGSATSTTPELLAAVKPRWAVISVGFRNQFRHPRPEVLQRLAGAGVSTYRTDALGAVTFYLTGDSVQPGSR